MPSTTGLAEVVASAQIHAGTRVIVLTAREPHPHHFVVETTAYDSAHPGEHLMQSVRSGPILAELVDVAREDGSRTFERSGDYDGCDCWATWDPHCGRPGCWGVYKPVAAR